VHSCQALHRIEVCSLPPPKQQSDHFLKKWNGSFFEKSSLKDAGLRIQLGHGGAKCIAPTPGPLTFIAIDVSGTHNVQVAIHFNHSLSLSFQEFTMLRLTSAIVAQMVSFPTTSNFYELVGFLLPSLALKQPSHFTVSISTMS
jgi:hypothetical protein